MPRPQTRPLATMALAALALVGLSACSALDHETFQDDAKAPGKVTAIRIDNDNGGVRLETSAGVSTVSVHRRVHYRGDKPSGTSFSVHEGVLTLADCGKDCDVDYVVKAPAGLPVTGSTSDGDLELTGAGPVDVRTSNGEITVSGAKGPVKLRTTNGNIDVKDVKGGIDARTSDGELTVRTATAQNIKARTTNGDLTVTAPPAPYRITASTSYGDKNVAFKNDPAGTYRLELATTSGDLTLRPAD
ncbi:DUF4097 domain-containing protein [Streptomyces sp. LP11]|uniref:DUF4097 domain-containing protein n=1 Tax=Streptomyces pyxinicus TaxID=2970331 RepID=A0ABT2B9Y4_9ACTN|nr:DUF4097 domain-containing protein [Streptomyces sp. LP11]MCS0605206.1 DUF4097 domain-containing protein [Streptomyces sp. LP11]